MKFSRKLKQFWRFLWDDDSLLSWILNIVLAFLIIKFIFFPGLSLVLQTPLPMVAVVSGSMEHKFVPPCTEYVLDGVCVKSEKSRYELCGKIMNEKPKTSFQTYWQTCGWWYEDNYHITQEEFGEFSFSNGFNVGDVMLIRGKKFQNVEIGDIIVFESLDGIPIIHRVVSRTEDSLRTKGDHNADSIPVGPRQEVSISEEQYIGTAAFRIPWIGHVKLLFVKGILIIAGLWS